MNMNLCIGGGIGNLANSSDAPLRGDKGYYIRLYKIMQAQNLFLINTRFLDEFFIHITLEKKKWEARVPVEVGTIFDQSRSNLQELRVLYILFSNHIVRPEKVSGSKGLIPQQIRTRICAVPFTSQVRFLPNIREREMARGMNNVDTKQERLASCDSIERYTDCKILESRNERHSMNSRDGGNDRRRSSIVSIIAIICASSACSVF